MIKTPKQIILLVLFCSLFSLIVTIANAYNIGVYVDSAGTSPDKVLGGQFWLNANWLQMLTAFLATVFSAILLKKSK